MAYACRSCNFFDGQGDHPSSCPTCGDVMRFTMFDPNRMASVPVSRRPRVEGAKTAWHNPYKYGYEEIEASWSFRYAQIGVGISGYYLIARVAVPVFMLPLAIAMSESRPEIAVLVLGFVALLLYCLAALGGGAVAGLWARNWLPQGIGVAIGVSVVPLIIMIAFMPEAWPMFCFRLLLTNIMTILGAFLGHLLVKPTRLARS